MKSVPLIFRKPLFYYSLHPPEIIISCLFGFTRTYSGFLPQVGSRKWQLTNPLARRDVDGIAERGNKRGDAGLTHSRRRRITVDQVDIGLIRSLVDAGNRVAIEIRLLNRAVLGGDFSASGDTSSESPRAFELRLRDLRIHYQPRVHYAVDAWNSNVSLIVHLDFNHRRNIGEEAAMGGNAQAGSLAQFAFSPTGLLNHHLGHAPQTAGLPRISIQRSSVIRILDTFEINRPRP